MTDTLVEAAVTLLVVAGTWFLVKLVRLAAKKVKESKTQLDDQALEKLKERLPRLKKWLSDDEA